jgi:hypothetical protein
MPPGRLKWRDYVGGLNDALRRRGDQAALHLVKLARFITDDRQIRQRLRMSENEFQGTVDRIHRIHKAVILAFWTHARLGKKWREKVPTMLLQNNAHGQALRQDLAVAANLLGINADDDQQRFRELVQMDSAEILRRCNGRIEELEDLLVRIKGLIS